MSAAQEFRPVVGFETHYEVSRDGQVRRIAAGKGAAPGRICTPRLYGRTLCVGLSVDGDKRIMSLAKIVREAWDDAAPAEFAVKPRGRGPKKVTGELEAQHAAERSRNVEECRTAVLEVLRNAEIPLHATEIAAFVGHPVDRVREILRRLSTLGLARIHDVLGDENRRQRWTNTKIARLRPVGHMLNEAGERFDTCTRASACLDAASRAGFRAARCPVDCTSKALAPAGAELEKIAGARRAVQW